MFGRSVEKHRNKLLVTLRRLMNVSIQRLCSLGALLQIKDLSGVLTTTPTKRKKHRKSAFSFWSKCGDSNSRPPVPETGALPTALHLEKMVLYARYNIVRIFKCHDGLPWHPITLNYFNIYEDFCQAFFNKTFFI